MTDIYFPLETFTSHWSTDPEFDEDDAEEQLRLIEETPFMLIASCMSFATPKPISSVSTSCGIGAKFIRLVKRDNQIFLIKSSSNVPTNCFKVRYKSGGLLMVILCGVFMITSVIIKIYDFTFLFSLKNLIHFYSIKNFTWKNYLFQYDKNFNLVTLYFFVSIFRILYIFIYET